MNPVELEQCRKALQLAAPAASASTLPTQGGRLSSGDWPRLDLIKTNTVQYAYLVPKGASASLRVFPADTLTQARVLYEDAGRVDALLRLRQRGWEITPNMHFGFASRGLAWMTATADVEDYTNYWLAAIAYTNELERHEWPRFLSDLFTRRFASPGDEEIFRQAFDLTKRQRASPRPGLQVIRQLSAAPSNTDALAEEVGVGLREVLNALREPLATLA